jgi:2-polyprenyl-6-methoxyphenol hydroxylase-like FAD-dependent oxidoreductase
MKSNRAVVIGGGIGGMCAARVLSDYFESVTLIERDELPEGAAHRKGVPQSRHPHGLLDRGHRELSALFPGLDDSIRARGGLDMDAGLELATLQPDGWATRRRTGHQMLFASRLLIESVIRDRIRSNPRIQIVEGTEVTGLLFAPEGNPRITGVEIRKTRDAMQAIEADLVVDCSGASSRASEWLARHGYPEVEVEIVDAQAAYSTCWYQMPPRDQRPASWWWKGIFLNPSMKSTRDEDYYFALILPIEGDRFLLTLASWGGRALPADHESFAALCAKLRSPIVAEALAISTPISPIFPRKGMRNVWRHYEKQNGPAGFVSVADAACSFNPVYAQGMTSATVCAQLLGQVISEMNPAAADFPARFFKRQADFQKQPWDLSVARDRQALARDGDAAAAEGAIPSGVWERILREGAGVPVIAEALFDVINLNRPPESLATDSEFLAAVNEIMQRPARPLLEADQVPPYPPAAIADLGPVISLLSIHS